MSKRISELPVAVSVGGSDLIAIVQTGTTKQATVAMLPASVGGASGPPAVVVVSGSSRLITAADNGKYLRFTASGAKTATLDPDEGYAVDDEYHIANRASAGDLTIQGIASWFQINPPKGGTLVLEPGDTVTIKMVVGDSAGVDEADVFGSTKDE